MGSGLGTVTGKADVPEGDRESPPPDRVLKGEKESAPIRNMRHLGRASGEVGPAAAKSSGSAHPSPLGWLRRDREGTPGPGLMVLCFCSSLKPVVQDPEIGRL